MLSAAEVAGFSIHAGVVVAGHDRVGLERLVRYVARPPFFGEQLQEAEDGRIALKLSKARKNGATHAFFSPLQLIRRLTSLITPAGQNLIRYFGILGPAARLREKVVPCPKVEIAVSPNATTPSEPARRSNIDWASLLQRVFGIDALACPCGGRIRIRSVIEDPAVIRRILDHLGLDTEAPRFAPARAPP
jgi:hypothetical protein